MRRRRLYLMLGMMLAAGCSEPTLPRALDGTWEESFNFPGSSWVFTLDTNGNSVSGSGTWVGEACCGGTLTVAGTVAGSIVTLNFSTITNGGGFPPPTTSQFTGSMTDRNTLVGTFSRYPASDVTFHRTR